MPITANLQFAEGQCRNVDTEGESRNIRKLAPK